MRWSKQGRKEAQAQCFEKQKQSAPHKLNHLNHPLHTITTVPITATMSSRGSDTESIHSALSDASDSVSNASEPEEGTDSGSEAEVRPTTAVTAETVREVFVISEEDAREHEDAVELVNWSTFDDWKRPWHIVKLWEGSVYDEMTLWGSIPLQNDKLRKVLNP